MTFYRCSHCGNIIAHIHDSGVRCYCCGEKMEPLVPNTSDGSGEKHVPVISVSGNEATVFVGSSEHPMTDQHFIEWILLETKQGRQRKKLVPGSSPSARFLLTGDDEVISAYCYCNLHGLWSSSPA
ncbi:MAG: desulfoferrodoxin [Clostridia bacterium]|nr:desulfoferrodoxin [Clostridia bacterium]